jgi:fucose 4-O-acetylase-like acetyltransferase
MHSLSSMLLTHVFYFTQSRGDAKGLRMNSVLVSIYIVFSASLRLCERTCIFQNIFTVINWLGLTHVIYFTQSCRAAKGLRVNSVLVSTLYCILCVFAALRENLYSQKLPEKNFISQGPPAFFLSCLQVFLYLSCSCLAHLQ